MNWMEAPDNAELIRKMPQMPPKAPILTTPPPRVLLTLWGALRALPSPTCGAAAATGPCRTQMRAYPRDTGRPRRGGRGGVQWDETILLNADSHSAGWRRDAQFPHPSPKAGSRSSPFAAYARSSGRKEDGLRGHMLHAQKRCQARMLFRGDTTIISPSSPGSSQACKAAILKWISQLQTLRWPNLSFPFLPPLL